MAKIAKKRKPAGRKVWQDDKGYLEVRKVGPYSFAHETKSNGEKIALLPFAFDDENICWVVLRHELMDSWTGNDKEKVWTEITGSWDNMKLSLEETAINELEEEANIKGYKVKDLVKLGRSFAVKCLDTRYNFFAIEVDKDKFKNSMLKQAEGDASGLEQLEGAAAKWVKLSQATDKMADAIGLVLVQKLADYIEEHKDKYIKKESALADYVEGYANFIKESKIKEKSNKAVPFLVEADPNLQANLAALWQQGNGQQQQ